MNRIKKREDKFTQVSNSFLRDNRISFKAKGLFCYMFSMSENWNFTLQSIATQQKDGLDSVKSAMDELKEYGYISYEKHSNGTGTYFLNDEPNMENPNVENPNLGKSTPIKNKDLDKNKNINYDEYLLLWNDFATRNKKSKIVKLTNTRKKQIANRLNDYKNFLEIFKYVLIKAEKTNFLLEGSFFDFDWITKNDTNIAKILEGKYDNRKNDFQEVIL
jgi:hypothetical protein